MTTLEKKHNLARQYNMAIAGYINNQLLIDLDIITCYKRGKVLYTGCSLTRATNFGQFV